MRTDGQTDGRTDGHTGRFQLSLHNDLRAPKDGNHDVSAISKKTVSPTDIGLNIFNQLMPFAVMCPYYRAWKKCYILVTTCTVFVK
jgi:hypothetical protein